MINMLFYVLSIFSLTLVYSAFGLFTTGESTLPITTCKRDSVDYSTCLKHYLKEAWPRFIKGLPEFDFPSLDPLFYEYGKVVFISNVIRGELIMSNLTGIGLSKAHFSDVRTHYIDDVFRLEIDTLVPNMFIKGASKINGTLGVFRVAGEGHFNVTTDDVRGTWDITGRVVNDTWIVEHFRTFPSIGKLRVYLDNFFPGNKELNDLILIFVNEYWPAIYRAMLPYMADIWDKWLVEFPNKIFSKVSFSKMFP